MVHQADGFSERGMSGTAYVSSWIKALENDPTDIRAAAVDAQQMSDWLIARERERSKDAERTEHESSGREADRTREPGEPDRIGTGTISARDRGQPEPGVPEPEMARSARARDSAVGERTRDSGPAR